MPISLIILFIVLLAIALRKLGPLHIPIWVIMLLGALASLLSLQISVTAAWHAIDWNIIGYLIGVFIIGEALEQSGYLQQLCKPFFQHSHRGFVLLLLIFFVFGISSALLMNDTLAIIATPLLMLVAKKQRISSKPLLLALAFAITIGSCMTPIGNPQNLLIAISGNLPQPFLTFFQYLFVATIINLAIGVIYMFILFRKPLQATAVYEELPLNLDKPLARLCKISLSIMLILIIAKVVLVTIHSKLSIPFSLIALASCLPILLFSKQRVHLVKTMDWGTIIFFIAMFVLMQSVWDSGFFQHFLDQQNINISKPSIVMVISVILSQFISNVPLVALYLPILTHVGADSNALMALAAGSTIAGNFLIMGAASNIIIIQNAEKRGEHAFGFFEFALIGIPLGVINCLVYWVFL